MNGYDVFAHSTFRFHGVHMKDGRVVAALSEKDGGCFGQSVSYTQDELQTHGLLEGCLKSIEEGFRGERIERNRHELAAAYEAIRSKKMEKEIPLDVS